MGFFEKLFKKNSINSDTNEGNEQNKRTVNNATVLKFDGLKALRMGNIPFALKFLEEALRLNPEFETRFYLAQALSHAQRNTEAIEQFGILLAEEPNHLPSLLERSRLLLEEDNASKAIEDIEKALPQAENDNEKATILRLKARALLTLKQYTEAIAIAEATLEINPDDTYSALTKTVALVQTEEFENALNYIKQCKEKFPEEERFLLYEANIYSKIGNPEKAFESLEKTLEVDPFNEEAIIAMAKHLQQQNKATQALELVENFVNEGTPTPTLLSLYTHLLRNEGRESDAQQIEQQIGQSEHNNNPGSVNLQNSGGIY